MATKTAKLLWNPKNPNTKLRGPTVQDWPDGYGKNEKHFAEENNGVYTLDAPYDLASHLLTEESPKWELLEPEKLLCQYKDGFGCLGQKTIYAKKQIPIVAPILEPIASKPKAIIEEPLAEEVAATEEVAKPKTTIPVGKYK